MSTIKLLSIGLVLVSVMCLMLVFHVANLKTEVAKMKIEIKGLKDLFVPPPANKGEWIMDTSAFTQGPSMWGGVSDPNQPAQNNPPPPFNPIGSFGTQTSPLAKPPV